jgi:conjugation system TraG family ATPase
LPELSFNSFYEYSVDEIKRIKEQEDIEFDYNNYRYILKKFYRGGEYETILNDDYDSTLFNEKFIVFEVDTIKENKILFPITTLIIMDVFIQKMRHKSNKKILVIEEAWKAIASPMMAVYILYLYKTVRKFKGEAMVVTQELNDIVGNEVVKDSILVNSDTICLLDQSKFKNDFDNIEKLLGIDEVEKNKIFTVNRLDNRANRSDFKEVYIKRGQVGEVYGVEVSLEEYLTYTTELSEREVLEYYLETYSDYQTAMDTLVQDFKRSKLSKLQFIQSVNRKISMHETVVK